MIKLSKIKPYFKNPWRIFYHFNHSPISKFLPDGLFLKLIFRARLGYKLDLKNPKTFNEKLQWLKLYNKNPLYSKLVDKYEVRNYVAEKIGGQYLIPFLGVWDCFEDIDFNQLPNQFVLKCTHDSGSIVICKDKQLFDMAKAKERINSNIRKNFFYQGREWPYKNVKPRIIAEKYMTEYSNDGINDYKFMCFNGEVKCLFVITNRYNPEGMRLTFFDKKWKKMNFERHYRKSELPIARPRTLNKMIESAEVLSKEMPFVRIDFYEIQGEMYFGEFTFYPGNGFEEFTPEEIDTELGNCIELPEISIK